MRLSKTAHDLLQKCANKQQDTLTIEYFYGRGPEGGKVSNGIRNFRAAEQLAQLGYLKLKSRDKSAISEKGFTTFAVLVKYEITSIARDKFIVS